MRTADGDPAEAIVVVTGVGLVTPIGGTREATWESVLLGTCGLRTLKHPDAPHLFVGAVDDGLPNAGRAARYLATATREALAHAGLALDTIPPDEIGAYVGTCGSASKGAGPLDEVEQTVWGLAQGFADIVAEVAGATGPRLAVNTACAGGAHAVALAFEHLLDGRVRVALAGGTDQLSSHIMSGFRAVKALDHEPCSPYGRSAGLSLGEGAAVLVLERLDDATARGATVLAEVGAIGLSADAYHATAPDPNGAGAELALRRAGRRAGIDLASVEYLNGHGTGTRANDEAEMALLERLWPDRRERPAISATKSMTGHALGASAAIECALTALAIQRGALPPNAGSAPPGGSADVVWSRARHVSVDVAASTSYAFGGCNAAVLMRKSRRRPAPTSVRRPVVVSGIGCIGAPGAGLGAWWEALTTGEPAFERREVAGRTLLTSRTFEIPNDGYAPTHVWNRTDWLTQELLAAVAMSTVDAGNALDVLDPTDVGVLLTSWAGAADTARAFASGTRSSRGVNPAVVSNAPINAPAGAVTRRYGLRGPNMTIVSPGLGGWGAIDHAVSLVERGVTDAMFVVAAEMLSEWLVVGYRDAGGIATASAARPFDRSSDGAAIAECGVAILVEAADRAAARGHVPYCRIAAGRAAHGSVSTTADGVLDRALRHLGWSPGSVDLVVAAATGVPSSDVAEAGELALTFVGEHPSITAPASSVGETVAASALVNVLVAAQAIRRGTIPHVRGLQSPAIAGLRYVVGEPEERAVDRALVLARDTQGGSAALGLSAIASS